MLPTDTEHTPSPSLCTLSSRSHSCHLETPSCPVGSVSLLGSSSGLVGSRGWRQREGPSFLSLLRRFPHRVNKSSLSSCLVPSTVPGTGAIVGSTWPHPMLLAPSRDKLLTDKRTQEASLFECRAVRKPRCMGVEASVWGKQRSTSPASQRHQGCSNWDTLYQCLKQGSGKSLRELGFPIELSVSQPGKATNPAKLTSGLLWTCQTQNPHARHHLHTF